MFDKKPIINEHIKFAAHKNSALKNKKLLLSDLKDCSFVSLNKGSSLYRITKEFCNKAGFEPNIVIEVDDPKYLRKYVKEGFGICAFPEESWKDDKDEDICYLNVSDFIYTRTSYVYLNNTKKVSDIAQKFFDGI